MMKYICTETPEGKHEIFTFPRDIEHAAMAEVLWHIKDQTHGNWKRIPRMPISAGFVDHAGTCFGESESLKLKSRAEDTGLLAEQAHR